MADSWGAISKPTTSGRAIGEEGAVIQPHASGGSSPRHEVNYSATDARGGHARDLSGWASVDHMSGPVTDTDWENSTGHFPDGPGVWRQT
jgi:hypothetical protein